MMSSNFKITPSKSLGLAADLQPRCSTPDHLPASRDRAVVVGLYGVPGSGKSLLLRQLKQELGQKHFAFYEGSEMIASVVPGGLAAFHRMEEKDKIHWRGHAIDAIRKSCADSGQVAVVAGHFMFWSEMQEVGTPVYTQNDLDTFTHILYLDVPAKVIAQRRQDDTERSRPPISAVHLNKWQQAEETQLRGLCHRHGILFALIYPHPTTLNKTAMLLRDFRHHNEEYNTYYAANKLDEVIATSQGMLKTVLVMDADRTLAAEDTGTLFWDMVCRLRPSDDEGRTLKALFSSPLGYSYTAFRQATLLYEETADDQQFDDLCHKVASTVIMYPEFVSLLQLVAEQEHVIAIIMSCGLRRVWELVLEKEGLSEKIKVLGGGRVADGFVVSATVKGDLVARLQKIHQMHVWAFGDSPLDVDMLIKADRAIVMVGEEQIRSKTMDAALINAIDRHGLRAHQAVLPSNALPRLDITKLPTIKLTDSEFIGHLLHNENTDGGLKVICATDKTAAKLLATPMRDATVAGPDLRDAHRRVGYYLAIEFVADVVGLDPALIRHVLGHQEKGYQLFHEQQTTIVALMRGGEPMAAGVNDALRRAMFVHAKDATDIKVPPS